MTLYILYLFLLSDLQNLFTFHLQQWFFFLPEAQTLPEIWKNQCMALLSPMSSRHRAGLKAYVLEVQSILIGAALQAPISSSSPSSARLGVENLCMLVKSVVLKLRRGREQRWWIRSPLLSTAFSCSFPSVFAVQSPQRWGCTPGQNHYHVGESQEICALRQLGGTHLGVSQQSSVSEIKVLMNQHLCSIKFIASQD